MKQLIGTLTMIWISAALMSACSNSKTKILGDDLPTMKAIHNKKFNTMETLTIEKPKRPIEESLTGTTGEFYWLPNPTLTMYVFKHLAAAGHPVPGYSTFFRLYTGSPIAEPGEQTGSE